MSLHVDLLGPPGAGPRHADVRTRAPAKVWAALAHFVLSDRAVTRRELAGLLCPEADDPLAALRNVLSRLRAVVGRALVDDGHVLRLALPADTVVDVTVLLHGTAADAITLPTFGGALLDGLEFPTSSALDSWLHLQRHFVAGVTDGVLREEATRALAMDRPQEATALAARLLERSPLDEQSHSLLVRSMAAAGDGVGAARQAARSKDLLQRELGIEPGAALEAAARIETGSAIATVRQGRAGVRAQLDAGRAAIGAGARDVGLECLRRAERDAAALRAPELHAETLNALGSALVHAAKGLDEEAAIVLHEAIRVAHDHDIPAAAAEARRELGYIDFLRGRYERARRWLHDARALTQDPAELANVWCTLGAISSDTGDHERSLSELTDAADHARVTGADQRLAYTESMIGRRHLLQGDLDQAREHLTTSLSRSESIGWTGFVPWPEALLGETERRAGALDVARERLDHAYALGCQQNDPCWEAVAARGLGLVQVAEGDVDDAERFLADALRRAGRFPDAYQWVRAWVLDALCDVTVAAGSPAAPVYLEQLEALTASSGMRELGARFRRP